MIEVFHRVISTVVALLRWAMNVLLSKDCEAQTEQSKVETKSRHLADPTWSETGDKAVKTAL